MHRTPRTARPTYTVFPPKRGDTLDQEPTRVWLELENPLESMLHLCALLGQAPPELPLEMDKESLAIAFPCVPLVYSPDELLKMHAAFKRVKPGTPLPWVVYRGDDVRIEWRPYPARAPGKKKRGRPPKITTEQLHQVRAQLGPGSSVEELIAAIRRQTGQSVSPATVRRRTLSSEK